MRARVSSSMAWPAWPAVTTNWSMMPQGECDVVVLCTLAEEGDFFGGECEARVGEHGDGAGDFDGCGGAEAGVQRDVAAEVRSKGGGSMPRSWSMRRTPTG